ncbi:MAG: MATE family efflux transporter [Butyrivibrio sp.]|nr:MATE family efflux transporter [Muribaculum sp.]MCM1551246.1 MATE family efflux transporter [Butyrivibrio sp.]
MEKEELFSRDKLLKLILPLVVEQILAVTVGMADMIMVSGAGEAAVSGISLVNTICTLLIMMFSALATGGAVVSAQYLGSQDKNAACKSADQLLLICGLTSIVIMALSLVANRGILGLIYGDVEKSVMDNAVIYFYITAVSFPFLAIYNACAGLFRSMNNSRISMKVSMVMNALNIAGNAVFVYGMSLGVAGVGLATLISRAVACIIMLILIRKPVYEIHITSYFKLGWQPQIIKGILKIGVPNALENSMFQIGKLLTQSLISSFGTAAIAANACASTVETLADIPAIAIGLGLTTVVGQCVGAGDYAQARAYAKKLIKYAYIFLILLNIIIFAGAGVIAGWYNLTDLGNHYALQLIRYHSVCCMAIWPLAFTIPSVLRAAGDVKYTMTVSVVSMWIFRIAFAYVIAGYFQMGVLGVWIAMTIDWAVRAVFNIRRFRSNKWEGKSVVKRSEAYKAA